MPYSGPDDKTLPPAVQAMRLEERLQWIAVFESVLAETQDEGEAMKTAFGAVKKDNAEQDLLAGVQLFAAGPVSHPVGDFEVDAEFCASMISAFETMSRRGYFPPVLAEHESDGTILGIVTRVYEQNGGIYADLELAEGVKGEVASGRRRNVSPSFYEEYTDIHTGQELRNFLREVSFVSVPHLKNLEPIRPHYTMAENGLIKTGEEPVEEMTMNEHYEERMALLEERLAALEAYLAEKKEEHAAEEEMESAEEYAEKEMSERIAFLERSLATANAINSVKSEFGFDDVTTKDLAELLLDKPELYKRQAKRLTESVKNQRGYEIGSIGTATVGAITLKEARSRAAKAGCKAGAETITYITQNHPELLK